VGEARRGVARVRISCHPLRIPRRHRTHGLGFGKSAAVPADIADAAADISDPAYVADAEAFTHSEAFADADRSVT
jgi:hypothetical protein